MPETEQYTGNLNRFMEVYEKNLRQVTTEHPEHFPWLGHKPIAEVVAKMREAIPTGNIILGPVMRTTLKEIGVRPTYTAISEWLKHEKLPKTLEQAED